MTLWQPPFGQPSVVTMPVETAIALYRERGDVETANAIASAAQPGDVYVVRDGVGQLEPVDALP